MVTEWTSSCSSPPAGERLVHDDDIAGPEGRHERLGEVGEEAFTIDQAVEDARCGVRSCRRAARKVSVRQWPCGTVARSGTLRRHDHATCPTAHAASDQASATAGPAASQLPFQRVWPLALTGQAAGLPGGARPLRSLHHARHAHPERRHHRSAGLTVGDRGHDALPKIQ